VNRAAGLLALVAVAPFAASAAATRAPGAAPHPADEGYAELEYAPNSGALEVALRVDSLTLDQALSAWTGREVRLDDPKGEVAVVDYLAHGFRVEQRRALPGSPAWTPCAQEFLGYEFEEQGAWLYFEVAVPAEPADLRVSFEMLFDLYTTQVNELFAFGAAEERAFVFRWESGWADLSFLLRPPAPDA